MNVFKNKSSSFLLHTWNSLEHSVEYEYTVDIAVHSVTFLNEFSSARPMDLKNLDGGKEDTYQLVLIQSVWMKHRLPGLKTQSSLCILFLARFFVLSSLHQS